MEFDFRTTSLVNRHRRDLQKETKTIDQGESVSIALWWSFICDHAQAMGHDPEQLARSQLESFIEAMPVKVLREH